jgi:hypothetical protein
MCIQALPLILSAAGAGMQQVGANQAHRDQLRTAGDNQRRQEAINRRAGERVNQQIQTVAEASPDAERTAATNDFMAALRKAKAADGGDSFGEMPGGSDRFAADVGQARTAAGAEGRQLAGNLAAIDAPQYARVNEARGLTDAAVDLDLLGGESRGQDFLSQLRLARAAGAGNGLESIGGGLSAFGGAMATRAVKPKVPAKTTRFLPGAP